MKGKGREGEEKVKGKWRKSEGKVKGKGREIEGKVKGKWRKSNLFKILPVAEVEASEEYVGSTVGEVGLTINIHCIRRKQGWQHP